MKDCYVLFLNAEKCLDTWNSSSEALQSARDPSSADNTLDLKILWNVKTKVHFIIVTCSVWACIWIHLEDVIFLFEKSLLYAN